MTPMLSTRSKLPARSKLRAAWLVSLAALLLPAMATSETSPLLFGAAPVGGRTVVLSIDRQQSNAVRLDGFDLAKLAATRTSGQRQAMVANGRLVATGAPLDIGALPAMVSYRLDHVWQVAVGAEVEPESVRISAELVGLSQPSASGPGEVTGIKASVETFRHAVRFDPKRQMQIIDGGLVIKLKTDTIGQAGNYQVQIVMTTEGY